MKYDTSIKRNYAYNIIYQVLTMLVPLITTPYVSRVLNSDGVGIYSYSFAIISSFIMFGSLGIATHGQMEVASKRNNMEQVTYVFYEIVFLKIITMMITYFFFLIFIYSRSMDSKIYLIQSLYFVAAIFDISWFFQGIEQFKKLVLRNIIIKLVTVLLIFVVIKSSDDLWLYLIILSLTMAVGNLTMWIYIPSHITIIDFKKIDIFRHLRATFIYFIPTVTYQIYAVLDKAMLGMIVGSNSENGYYEQANKIVFMLISFISSYNIVMRSRMSYLFSSNSIEVIRDKLGKSVEFILFISVGMAFGILGTAKGLVPWFLGPDYEKVIVLLYIFSPIFVSIGLASCFGTHIFTPGGMQNKSNRAQITAALVSLALNWILIPTMQSYGAAISSVLSQILILFIYIYYIKEYIAAIEIVQKSIKYVIAGFAMLILLVLLDLILTISILSTLIEMIVGALVYLSLLIILKDNFTISACEKMSKICKVLLVKQE